MMNRRTAKMNNAELIAALRYHARATMWTCTECPYDEIRRSRGSCLDKMLTDAADLIEAQQVDLRKANEIIAEGIKVSRKSRAALEIAEKRIAELEAQMPKEGEWIEDTTTYAGPCLSNYKCSLCGKICGTWRRGLKPSELPNWCGNCGAKMKGEQE
jgi:exonuclease VII small subunit